MSPAQNIHGQWHVEHANPKVHESLKAAIGGGGGGAIVPNSSRGSWWACTKGHAKTSDVDGL